MWTPMTTRMTSTHCTSTIAWRFTPCTFPSSSTERANVVLFLAHFITLTLAQVRALSALHSRPSSWPSMWLLSLRLDFLLLPLRFPPVLLPLPLLPPQRRAAAGAQQEDHGKPALLRDQREWGHLRPQIERPIARISWKLRLRRSSEVSTTAIPGALRKLCKSGARQRQQTFNSNIKIVKERIWITVKLTIQNRGVKVDVEPNTRSQTYSRSSILHVRLSKKSKHEQEASNESSMYGEGVCWCHTQDKENAQEVDAWWFDPCWLCWTWDLDTSQMTKESLLQFEGEWVYWRCQPERCAGLNADTLESSLLTWCQRVFQMWSMLCKNLRAQIKGVRCDTVLPKSAEREETRQEGKIRWKRRDTRQEKMKDKGREDQEKRREKRQDWGETPITARAHSSGDSATKVWLDTPATHHKRLSTWSSLKTKW